MVWRNGAKRGFAGARSGAASPLNLRVRSRSRSPRNEISVRSGVAERPRLSESASLQVTDSTVKVAVVDSPPHIVDSQELSANKLREDAGTEASARNADEPAETSVPEAVPAEPPASGTLAAPLASNSADAAELRAGVSEDAAGSVNGHGLAYAVGTSVRYWSKTHRKWIGAVVEAVNFNSNSSAVVSYDLDCKPAVDPSRLRLPSEPLDGPPESFAETPVPDAGDPDVFEVGKQVEYWSDTHGKWIASEVQSIVRTDERVVAYNLAAKQHASVGRVRARSESGLSPGPPVTLPDGISNFSVGERVQYWSDTKSNWVESVISKRYDRDGKTVYDTTCKKCVISQRLRPSPAHFRPGDSVLYYSDSAKKWLPAQLLHINKALGKVDLNIKPHAPLERLRKVTPGASAKRAVKRIGGAAAPQDGVNHVSELEAVQARKDAVGACDTSQPRRDTAEEAENGKRRDPGKIKEKKSKKEKKDKSGKKAKKKHKAAHEATGSEALPASGRPAKRGLEDSRAPGSPRRSPNPRARDNLPSPKESRWKANRSVSGDRLRPRVSLQQASLKRQRFGTRSREAWRMPRLTARSDPAGRKCSPTRSTSSKRRPKRWERRREFGNARRHNDRWRDTSTGLGGRAERPGDHAEHGQHKTARRAGDMDTVNFDTLKSASHCDGGRITSRSWKTEEQC